MFGFEEGSVCNRDGCRGFMEFLPVENCSCHIAPPCPACEESRPSCPECGWEYDEELDRGLFEDQKSSYGVDLDLAYTSHTHSSTKKGDNSHTSGIPKQVVDKVRGMFVGKFARLYNGLFSYVHSVFKLRS